MPRASHDDADSDEVAEFEEEEPQVATPGTGHESPRPGHGLPRPWWTRAWYSGSPSTSPRATRAARSVRVFDAVGVRFVPPDFA